MRKALKIILVALAVLVSAVLLLFAFLCSRFASGVAAGLIEGGTGFHTTVSGLRVTISRPFPTLSVCCDSIFMRKDSLEIRLRGMDAGARISNDSLMADCFLGKNFIRSGSSRVILDSLALHSQLDLKDSLHYGTKVSFCAAGGKLISTLYPLRNRINGIDIVKHRDALSINSIRVSSGTTDACVTGAAGNLTEYLRGDGDLQVVLDIKSDNVNVNEILSGIFYGRGDPRQDYSAADEQDESFIEEGKYVHYPFRIKEIIPLILPENINVSADISVSKALVAILSMTGFSSHLDITDRTGKASECRFGSNFGDADLTMFYSSPSRDSLFAGVDLHLRHLKAQKVLKSLPEIKGLTPLLRSFKGEFRCDAALISQVDTAFIPLPNTMRGAVNFRGSNMSISDAGDLRKYTSMLMFRDKNIGDIDDINLYSIISDSRIKVFPMLVGVDRYLFAMFGNHSFDNVFDYDISVLKSPVPFRFGLTLHSDGGRSKVKFKVKKATYRDAAIPTFYKEAGNLHTRLSSLIDGVIDEGAVQASVRSARMTEELLNRHGADVRKIYGEPADTAMTSSLRQLYAPLSSELRGQ